MINHLILRPGLLIAIKFGFPQPLWVQQDLVSVKPEPVL